MSPAGGQSRALMLLIPGSGEPGYLKCRHISQLKIVSLIVFIPSFLYGAVTATKLFTLFQ